ncbi:MAG: phosphatidate cytidylyltransferase [Cyanobacteria bacterium P01_F01_bin.33]
MLPVNPTVFPLTQILAVSTGVSAVLAGIVSIPYRQAPEKVARIWQKLGILFLIIFVLVGAGSFGRWAFAPVALLLAYSGWQELLRCLAVKYEDSAENQTLLIGLGMAGVLGGLADSTAISIGIIGIAAWCVLSIPMLIRRQPLHLHYLLGAAFGITFVTAPLAVLLHMAGTSYAAFCFLVLVVMAHDGLSEGWGLAFGKTLLVPEISPSKTWEGALGGAVSSVGIAYILKFLLPEWPFLQVAIVAVGISLLSLTGDLIASSLKREANIKDFGRVLSVTGGVLDKFDSLFFATPMFFIVYLSFQ